MMKPPMSTNGTAIIASVVPCGSSGVPDTNLDGQPRRQREARDREADDPAARHVAIALVVGGRRAGCRDGADQAADDRLRKFQERPDRGNRNRAGADEAHLMPPDVFGVRGEVGARGRRLQRRQDRHRARPGDEQSGEHRHADRQPDEVAGAEQRERERDVVAAARRRADSEEPGDGPRGDACRAEDGETGRRDRSVESRPSVLRALRRRRLLFHRACRIRLSGPRPPPRLPGTASPTSSPARVAAGS